MVKISNRKIREFRKKLSKSDVFYTADFEIISKCFLKELADSEPKLNDVFTLDIDRIREIFVNTFYLQNEEVPINEVEFFGFICREYLGIKREPYYELLNLYGQVIGDLLQISENIAKCENEKTKIKTNKSYNPGILNPNILDSEAIEEERQSRQYVLGYYINENIKARDEIFEYLASERIKRDAYRNSVSDMHRIFRQPSYTYQHSKKLFDINSFSLLSNKFLDLEIKDHHRLKHKLSTDTVEFLGFVNNYIASQGIIKELQDKLYTNHRLSKRSEILNFALDCFESNQRNVFIHLAATQVEGLFYDYCLDMGLSQKHINSLHSINRKLDKLQEINSGFLDIAYYMFVFPIIRNRIAHGKIVSDDEVNIWSKILLFDLLDMFNRITSDNLAINKLLCSASQAIESEKHDDLIIALLLPLISPLKNMEDVLNFYDSQARLPDFKQKGRSPDFLKYLEKLVALDNYPILCVGIEKVINSLKKDDFEKTRYRFLFSTLRSRKPFLVEHKNELEKDYSSFLSQLDDASFRIFYG